SWKRAAFARKFNSWFGIVLVLAAIVGGFIIVGSPSNQRALRFDTQRVNDLSSIQWQIISYWQQKGKLPVSLSDLFDPLYGVTIPVDPDTKQSYEYVQKGATSFALCSTFSREAQDVNGRGSYDGVSRPTSGG